MRAITVEDVRSPYKRYYPVKELYKHNADDYIVADDDTSIQDDDWATCDDDWATVDADDAVCDDDRDGLTPEEVKAYEEECSFYMLLREELRKRLPWEKYYAYFKPIGRTW